MTRQIKGGIYVLKFSKRTVKIGMGSDIQRRLKQYRGYHKYGRDYKRLLIIKSKYPKELETLIHRNVVKKYSRIGRLEIFNCTEQQKLVAMIKKLVKDDRRLVNQIIDFSEH